MARSYKIQGKAPASRSGIDYRAELNDEQLAAVTSWPPGPAMVLAGAGSGKTRTLTYRVAWLLDRGIHPNAILLLTFTNKAAREMLDRVTKLVPFDISGLWGGTFHAIGNRMLRRHADLIGWKPSFSILDREDQKELLAAAIREAGVDCKKLRFPKPEVVGDILGYAANTATSVAQALECKYPYFAHFGEEIDRVAALYARKKPEVNSMDFDDLLLQSTRLLREQDDVREAYQRRFEFILVDEFQDTNPVQMEFVDLLAARHRSLMVVGDDAQSIYSWRGADFESILSFPERHPGASVHRIETNYRSVPEVLELANASIALNPRQFRKNLRAARPPSGELPALVALQDPRQQAAFVAQRILELYEEGVGFREMAVLYRAHFHSMDIQLELTARGIPFRVTSGLRFFEQAHVKDVAAFLRLAVNPQDEVAFLRLARMLPGVGDRTAAQLWGRWQAATAGGLRASHESIFRTLKVPAKASADWTQLSYTLDELVADGTLAKPGDAITSVIEGVYDDWMKEKFTNYESRRQDLEQLRQFADGHPDLESLLGELALLSGVDGVENGKSAAENEECVTLGTVHQAKGLEWHSVFLVWLAEGMFPGNRALEADDPTVIEEERRLFHVALTRAKDRLHLCYPVLWPGNYSGEILQHPSCFLAEIPQGLLEAWDVGDE